MKTHRKLQISQLVSKNSYKAITAFILLNMICLNHAMAQYFPRPRPDGISIPSQIVDKNAVSRQLNGTGFVSFDRLGDKSANKEHYIGNLLDKIALNFYMTPGGYAFEGNYNFSNSLSFAFGYDKSAISINNFKVHGSEMKINMNMPASFVMLKYKPNVFSNFYYAAGIYFGNYLITGSKTISGDYAVGENSYNFNDSVLSLTSESQRNIQPFLGVGFDKKIVRLKRAGTNSDIRFSAIAGLRYAGVGDVSLISNDSVLTNNTAFLKSLRSEVKAIKKSTYLFGFAPVIRIGIGYNF